MLSFNRNNLIIVFSLLLINVSTFCMSEEDRAAIRERQNSTNWEQTIDQGKSFVRPAIFAVFGTALTIMNNKTIMSGYNFSELTPLKKIHLLLNPLAMISLVALAEGAFGQDDQHFKTRSLGIVAGIVSGYLLERNIPANYYFLQKAVYEDISSITGIIQG